MDPRLQRRVQRYGWDKAASYYEEYWRRQIEPAQTRLLELADLRPGERVLDVACGTGLVSFPAATAVGPEGSVVGTDLSDEMVNAAHGEAAKQGLSHTAFERMDAEALTLPDESFDAALCSLGLMYVPDPLEAMKQMHRVLKPGGRAAVAIWGPRDRCGWAEIFPIVDARVSSEVCPLFFRLGTRDTMERTFEDAGFAEVGTDRLTVNLHYDSPKDACGAAFAGGPVALAYSRFDEPTRQEAHAEYLASIAAYANGSAYDIPGEFVVTWGRKQ